MLELEPVMTPVWTTMNPRAGYTLIEVLIMLAVTAILAATVLETEGEVAEMKLCEKALAEAAAIERVRWEGGAKRGAMSLAAEFGLPRSWWDR